MIAVIGDVMLDVYQHGSVSKVNPEGPGVVVKIQRKETRPGGAASVAAMIRGLGEEVAVIGAHGSDKNGIDLIREIRGSGAQCHPVIIPRRQTTVKTRIVADGALMHNRFDEEDTVAVNADDIMLRVQQLKPSMIVISDYGKGVVTPHLMYEIYHYVEQVGDVPVLVDPGDGVDWRLYKFVTSTLIKANFHEARKACEQLELYPTHTHNAFDIARVLAEFFRSKLLHVVVTAGDGGLCYSTAENTKHFAAKRVEVRDTCGAGDAALAALAVSIHRGASPEAACGFAIEVSSEQVKHLGATAVRWNYHHQFTATA